ncbi:MAG: Fic family protein [Gemmatimonadetes bacterium]|nr:Fic family protein [Gemmatimonadota bacterium]
MKIPLAPPDPEATLSQLMMTKDGANRTLQLLTRGMDPAPGGKYRHWDVLRHLTPPGGLTPEEWWVAMKVARRQLYRRLPLKDVEGRPFRFAVADPVMEMLHFIDQAGGAVKGSDIVTDPETRETYLMKSLLEEAITSSQLEGASTTKEVAKDMLQRGRQPRDRSEQMIYNNYQAMLFIRSAVNRPLTPQTVFELHRILADKTLDDPSASGRFRNPEEAIHVVDNMGNVLHVPPAAAELPQRLDTLCALANDKSNELHIHPVVRAILLHFGLAYDHPFIDGNGRTARALFYWAMAARGYWLCESLSISSIIKTGPSKYARAFLYTETDEGDVTYFILNQLRVIVRAIETLHERVTRKAEEIRETRMMIQQATYINAMLNHRQLALVTHALKNPGFVYAIESHKRSHNVSYQTARTDLLQLAELGFVDRGKSGRAFIFVAPQDLRDRLTSIARNKQAIGRQTPSLSTSDEPKQ